MNCEQARRDMHAYLDRELDAAGILGIEAHLSKCQECRQNFSQWSQLSQVLRTAAPIYPMPPAPVKAVHRILRRHKQRVWALRASCAAAVLALAAMSLWTAQWAHGGQVSRRFEAFAADAHARSVRGLLPLDVVSADSQEVNAWLARRLAFRFRLPDYPVADQGSKRYSLRGTRLLQFENADAAYIAYDMSRGPISLVAAPAARVTPVGGEMYRSGGLDFHLVKLNGYQVIAWTDRGTTYALVSNVAAETAQSCVVCHGGASDQRKLDDLKPVR